MSLPVCLYGGLSNAFPSSSHPLVPLGQVGSINMDYRMPRGDTLPLSWLRSAPLLYSYGFGENMPRALHNTPPRASESGSSSGGGFV